MIEDVMESLKSLWELNTPQQSKNSIKADVLYPFTQLLQAGFFSIDSPSHAAAAGTRSSRQYRPVQGIAFSPHPTRSKFKHSTRHGGKAWLPVKRQRH